MIEIILDASQIEYFEKCERSWFHSNEQDLVPTVRRKSFDVGSYWHAAMEYYYSNPLTLNSYAKRMGATMAFMRKEDVRKEWGISVKDADWHIERFRKYCYRWFGDDESMQVIAVEKGFSWLLYEDFYRRYILEGKIDLIARTGMYGLAIIDHKTQSRKYSKYPMNHQCMNYFNYMKQMGLKPDYFIYNYIGLQDTVNADTFRREIVKPTDDMLDEWKLEVVKTFDDMYNCIKKRDELITLGGIQEGSPALEQAFPKRRSACQSQFGLCAYFKLCGVPDTSPWRTTVYTAYQKKDNKWRAWS